MKKTKANKDKLGRLNKDIITQALQNSKASVEFEGVMVSQESDEICERMLKG